MTKSNTSLFSSKQKNALAALGLPVWHKRECEVMKQAEFYYRLGPWLIIVSQQLPVKKPQWLLDLALWLDTPTSALAEISSRQISSWPPQNQLRIAVNESSALTGAAKRELWHQLMTNKQ